MEGSMQDSIKEIKDSIKYHQKRVSQINWAMWLLIMLAAILFLFIYSMLDTQVKNLADIMKYAASAGIKTMDSAPTSMSSPANNSNLGFTVIAMCVARLLVYFGQLRFHLKEISLHQQELISLTKIRAAQNSELPETVRGTLLRSATATESSEDPALHIPSEAIAKISEAVTDRLSRLISGKGH